MAATLNKVLLIGNLTRDPELRYVPSGNAVANFSIAVNRTYTTQAGERREEVCFVRIVAWSRLAEICGEYLSKGRSVFVEGRLQSRTWETEDGQKRTTFEVIADNLQFLDKTKADQELNKEPISVGVAVGAGAGAGAGVGVGVGDAGELVGPDNNDDVPF